MSFVNWTFEMRFVDKIELLVDEEVLNDETNVCVIKKQNIK